MLWTMAFAAALTGSAGQTIVHDVTVAHRGEQVSARYHGDVVVSTRQRGVAIATRASTERCDWTATMTVKRTFDESGAAARQVASESAANGSLSGNCRLMAKQIAREVAGRQPALQQRLVAIAEADRPKLLAELELIGRYAAND